MKKLRKADMSEAYVDYSTFRIVAVIADMVIATTTLSELFGDSFVAYFTLSLPIAFWDNHEHVSGNSVLY